MIADNDNKEEQNRWDKVVDRLIEQTQQNQIQWETVELPLRPRMQSFVGPQYATNIETRRVAVYEKAYPVEDVYGNALCVDSSIMVEFIDENNEVIWVWPITEFSRSELLTTIRDAWAEDKTFLNAVLGE